MLLCLKISTWLIYIIYVGTEMAMGTGMVVLLMVVGIVVGVAIGRSYLR